MIGADKKIERTRKCAEKNSNKYKNSRGTMGQMVGK
jgi:hypothetical protein